MERREFLRALPVTAAGAALLPPALLPATGARAQGAYPDRPVRYIVPVAPGGGSDMVGRTVTERWGAVLKQNFVVENQGGGGATIAYLKG